MNTDTDCGVGHGAYNARIIDGKSYCSDCFGKLPKEIKEPILQKERADSKEYDKHYHGNSYYKSLADEKIQEWYFVFCGLRNVSGFYRKIADAFQFANSEQQENLGQIYPQIYEGYKMWQTGDKRGGSAK